MKKYLLVLTVGIAIVILIASCYKKPKDNTILRIWQTETDPDAVKVLVDVAKVFEANHPGVNVQIESVAWDSLAERLNIAIQNKTVPDAAHLEPFMAFSLFQQGMLAPIDDVIDGLEMSDNIMPAVKDLQNYNGIRYGIAYAVGVTGWAYRKDLAKRAGETPPTKWKDYLLFIKKLKEQKPDAQGLTLPGGSPFFIDQLFAELVANNGGNLFDPNTKRPLFNSSNVQEVLEFFAEIGRSKLLDPAWTTTSYLDQFNRLAREEVLAVPVTYSRAGRSIQKVLGSIASASTLKADDSIFGLMYQPTGPSYNGPSIATIDCEPYVVFRAADSHLVRRYGSNAYLAKEFLKSFYKKENYLRFVNTVPIHLTPIFVGMSHSKEYTNNIYIQTWKSWYEHTSHFLADANLTRPILMTNVSEAGRQVPHLLELQSSRIIATAVAEVINGDKTPSEASDKIQSEVEKLFRQSGEN
jgi:ABC-type glycerol-3-phosphate transport system substrate-binding protein